MAQTASRERALAGRCFAGRRFYVTKSVKPDAKDLGLIISNAGGELVPVGLPGGPPADTLVISCEADRREFSKILLKGLGHTVLEDGHLLTCVMRQELQTSEGRLT